MKRAVILFALVACSDSAEESAQQLCVDETNKYRAMDGADPVERSSELATFAREGAEVDFGTQPHMHFGTDGGGVALAENECPQQDGWTVAAGETQKTVVSQCIRVFYEEGAGGGHYENLMGAYAFVGCGIYEQGGKITIVQDFGN
jgi:cysteine-rich secretory family protein